MRRLCKGRCRWIIAVTLVSILTLTSILLWSGVWQDLNHQPSRVTLDNYEKITPGMSMEELREILGKMDMELGLDPSYPDGVLLDASVEGLWDAYPSIFDQSPNVRLWHG